MPSFQDICTAIHDVFEAAMESTPVDLSAPTTVKEVYNFDELEEGMNSWPAIEIYVEEWRTSPPGETSGYTFPQSGVRRSVTEMVVRLDLYASHRSNLDEDWNRALYLANTIQNVLETNASVVDCPIFDLVGIRELNWTATRVIFERAQTTYTGYRFELNIRIY